MTLTRTAPAFAVAALFAACSPPAREPTPPERTDIPKIVRQIPPYEPMPGGNARTALLFMRDIPGLRARVEIREYYVSERNEITVSPPSEAFFEIRGGRLAVEAPNMKGEQSTGTTWTTAPNDRVTVRAASEVAILRATYVVRQ